MAIEYEEHTNSIMEVADPLQELLKTTGWSCDDLLEKLQKLKSAKSTISNKNIPTFVQPTQKTDTGDKKTRDTEKSPEKIISEEPPKHPDISIDAEPFSDTDDEEEEVHVTNQSIINEIIDDITSVDTQKNYGEESETKIYETNEYETHEVTEVRVIEVNNDEEDDNFEEACVSKSFSEDIQYWETYPRKSVCLEKPSIGSKRSAEGQSDSEDKSGKIEYIETYPRKRFKVIDENEKKLPGYTNAIVVHQNIDPPVIQTNGVTGASKDQIESCSPLVEANSNKLSTISQQKKEFLGTYLKFLKANEATANTTTSLQQKNSICNIAGSSLQKRPLQNDEIGKKNNIPDPEKSILIKTNILDENSEIQLRQSINCSQPFDTNHLKHTGCDTFSENLGCEEDSSNDEDESDENSLDSSVDDPSLNQEGDITSENVEDIRNNLKLQLTSLRTRKKEHFLQTQTKVIDSIECNKTLNLLSNEDVLKKHDDNKTKAFEEEKANSLGHAMEENQLFSQTNELGLVILDVQGGVDFEEIENDSNEKSSFIDETVEENSGSCSKNSEPDMDDDQHVVFDQIRKIIHKQKSCLNLDYDKSEKVSLNQSQVYCDEEKSFSKKSIPFPNNVEPSITNGNQEIKKKSPFVSDSLDEFLIGNSKLNISYKVPKSGAEDGLKENLADDSSLLLKKVEEMKNISEEKPKKRPALKAKTVAHKRKLLEREEKKEQRKRDKLKKIASYKIKKKAEKSNKQEEQNRSFVYYNNEKIWVKSKVSDKCIAKINCQSLIKDGSPINTKRKLSLLSQQRKFNMPIKYRPGPLCKKSELQITGQDDWETYTKKLPEILLEVTPTLGRRFPDHIINRLKIFDGKLHCQQIEFALSSLKTKKDEVSVQPRPFIFPLRYHNDQEQIIIRKRKSIPVFHESEHSSKKENRSRNTVADVIEDLIRYVEIKEIAPTLIKDDESQTKDEEKLIKKLSPIDSHVSIFKKPQKKKSKIETELLRLSCKVVNVELEENLTEEICENLHCQLGCVCKSLKCENISNYHCQLVKCMFDCTCPKEKALVYEHSLTLPAGTDILSTVTVNRIEDEAKKNLAKEEREFTQTVIHTIDKTIVVGLGSRSKLRRNTKTPAKYSDYVDSSENHKTKPPEKDLVVVMRCTVSLPRLNLSQIIPYCLTHNLYDCHCKGASAFIPNSSVYCDSEKWRKNHLRTPQKVTAEKSEQELSFKRFKGSEMEEPQEKNNHTSAKSSSQLYENTNIVSSSKRPIRNKKQKKYDENFVDYSNEMSVITPPPSPAPLSPAPPDSARTRMFLPEYRKPKDFAVDLYQNDFSNNINDSDIFRLKMQYSKKNQQFSGVEILKQYLIEQCMGNIMSDINKKKRKQTISVRKDEITSKGSPQAPFNVGGALQRRKKSLVSRVDKKVEAVFDGEIIIDRRNSELLKKMGPKTLQDGYARLLPWKALIESFNAGTINIWSMIDQPSRLLINRSTKNAPKNYVNIKQSNQTTDVILWILRNKLPSSYQEDTVSFILKETKNNFEICGVCTRKLIKEDCVAKVTEENESNVSSNNDEVFLHRDVNGDQQILETLKKKYKLQELVEESTGHLGEISVDKNKLYMWAALPEIHRVCKWRVIYLNSDFAYLYFDGIQYSIRYTDLVSAGRIAKENNCTLRLTNDTLKSGYDHKEFGLYFDPHYLDRFFIGPYFKHFSGDDVQTYRYNNKALISTKSFNQMSGKKNFKCGNWLIERPYSGKRFVRPESSVSTIDLTNEDDVGNNTENNPKYLRTQQSKAVLPHMVIMHNSEQVLIIDAPSRKPEDFNRYIITNIPHLGYLGAYRHSSGEIDVSWPFEEKLLRFSNVTTAIDFLQERFSALLQPVPEIFKINIIVLTQIDLNNSRPIDSAVLSGHYICGEFGFENITTMTSEDCMKKLGMSREEILSMFSRRAKIFLEKRIENLASLLNIKENNGYDISSVLNAATAEIRSQLNQENNNVSIKNALSVKKRENAIKLFNMVSLLPPLQRNIESQKLRMILKRSEPIEIHDSDEDVLNIDSDKNLSKDNTVDDHSDTGNPKNLNVSKDSTNDQSNTDMLKVLDPQQCLVSVMEAKNQTVLDTTEPKKNDSITSSPLSKSSPRIVKQKSLLKPLVRVPIDTERPSLLASRPVVSSLATKKENKKTVVNPNIQTAQYISGVKIVKSVSGNLVLVPDESPESDTRSSTNRGLLSGTKVIIQNNKIKKLKLQQEEVQARNFSKLSKGGPKVVPNKNFDFQVIESFSSIDDLNSDETIIIDLDQSNDADSVFIQNDGRPEKTKELCHDGRVENKIYEQDRYSDGKNEIVIITEDDILVHSDGNVQSNRKSVNTDEDDTSNEMMIIDLDESNELDNMLIQNDARSLGETRYLCDERMENETNEMEKSDIVTITEDDILIHSDDNVQNDHESINVIDITQVSLEYNNTVQKDSVYDVNSAERDNSHSGTYEVKSDYDLVFSVDENCDIMCDHQSTSNEDIIFQKT